MLPFLKKNKEASVAVPSDRVLRESDDEAELNPLLVAADDLISAIHSKDTERVAEALRAAFELCDAEPHVEGPHL